MAALSSRRTGRFCYRRGTDRSQPAKWYSLKTICGGKGPAPRPRPGPLRGGDVIVRGNSKGVRLWPPGPSVKVLLAASWACRDPGVVLDRERRRRDELLARNAGDAVAGDAVPACGRPGCPALQVVEGPRPWCLLVTRRPVFQKRNR